MQVRFIYSGQVARLMPDGTTIPFEVGIGDIHPCKEIVYDDETCEWADIHFNDGSVIEGIAGECFERMGSAVSYKTQTVNMDDSEVQEFMKNKSGSGICDSFIGTGSIMASGVSSIFNPPPPSNVRFG